MPLKVVGIRMNVWLLRGCEHIG